MPYIKDVDCARVVDLARLIKELAEKENHHSIPDIADRVLKIMAQYQARIESHSPAQDCPKRKGKRN